MQSLNLEYNMEGKSQDQINQEVHEALYGKNGNDGIVQQMANVDEILSAFRYFGRAVMWCALVLGSFGTAVGGVIETVKFWLKHK